VLHHQHDTVCSANERLVVHLRRVSPCQQGMEYFTDRCRVRGNTQTLDSLGPRQQNPHDFCSVLVDIAVAAAVQAFLQGVQHAFLQHSIQEESQHSTRAQWSVLERLLRVRGRGCHHAAISRATSYRSSLRSCFCACTRNLASATSAHESYRVVQAAHTVHSLRTRSSPETSQLLWHARNISPGRASPDARAPSPDILEGARKTPLSISRLLLLPQTSPPAPSPPLQPSSSWEFECARRKLRDASRTCGQLLLGVRYGGTGI
jgi:hypothetical protein